MVTQAVNLDEQVLKRRYAQRIDALFIHIGVVVITNFGTAVIFAGVGGGPVYDRLQLCEAVVPQYIE